MDGPIILALLDEKYRNCLENQMYLIRNIVSHAYEEKGIHVNNPVEIVALQKDRSVSMFLENVYSAFKSQRVSCNALLVNGNMDKKELIDDDQFRRLAQMVLQIHEDVLHSMKNFRVVIQPIVDATSEQVVGGEVLLRWKFNGEDISPGVFIQILENQNLIQQVGRFVFEQAVQMSKWLTCYNKNFYLSVNVSMLQLKDEGFIEFIQETLKKYQLSSHNIVMELTESVMDQSSSRVSEFVESCKKLGIELALDDFGTGYSCIANLFQYRTNIIKVDRSLLLEMEVDEERCKFVSSMIRTFKMTGRKVIVEGVETDAQKTLLKDSQCDCIQGFYFYRPLELNQFRKLFS